VAVGAKVTFAVQLAFAASVPPQVPALTPNPFAVPDAFTANVSPVSALTVP
jgi:hypothetical protein